MIDNLNRYNLKIAKDYYRCMSVNGKAVDHFVTPDTQAGKTKLYVLKDGREIYYVGVTSQSMSTRLRMGYKAKGEQGYHGYKWIGHISEAELLVWCFSNKDQKAAESIEGELVYLIRNKTGKWPTYQMEIHFHPDATNEEKQIAEYFLKECLK